MRKITKHVSKALAILLIPAISVPGFAGNGSFCEAIFQDATKARVLDETAPVDLSDTILEMVKNTTPEEKLQALARISSYQKFRSEQADQSEIEKNQLAQLELFIKAASGDSAALKKIPAGHSHVASVRGSSEIQAALRSMGVDQTGLEKLRNLTSDSQYKKRSLKASIIGFSLILTTFVANHYFNSFLGWTDATSHLPAMGIGFLTGMLTMRYLGNVNHLREDRIKESDFLARAIEELENPTKLKIGEALYFQRKFITDRIGILLTFNQATNQPVLDVIHWYRKPPAQQSSDPFDITDPTSLMNPMNPASPFN